MQPAVGVDGRDDGDAPAVGRAAEHHGPDAGLVAHGERELAQVVAVEAVDPGDDDAVDGRGDQLVGAARGPPGAAGP